MKKVLSFLIITSLLSFSSLTKVSAWADTIGGPANVVGWAAEKSSDAASLAEEIATTYATLSLSVKEYVLDPIARMFGQQAVNDIAVSTKNWALTGFKGDPVFITNPEVMSQNLATGVVRANIANVSNSNNPFANSVISSLVAKTRGDQSPLSVQIAPTLGNTVQNNVCTDANLTALAKKQMNSSVVYVNSAQNLESIKTQLRTKLCTTGAGGALNKTQQQTLTNCFANDFSCGGWNSWLNLGSNPNNTLYGQTVNAKIATAQTQAKKAEAQKAITVDGVMSITDCVDTPTNNQEIITTGNKAVDSFQKCINEGGNFDACNLNYQISGGASAYNNENINTGNTAINNPNKVPCQKSEVRTPSQLVSNTIKDSLNNVSGGIANAHEFSETLTSFVTKQLGGLMLSGFSDSNPRAGQTVALDTLTDPFNTPSSTRRMPTNTGITFSNPVDLSAGGDSFNNMSASTKETFTKAMLTELNYNKTTVNQLKTTDNKYISILNAHDSRLDTLSACYSNTLAYGRSLSLDGYDYLAPYNSTITTGQSYISSEKTALSNKKAVLNLELSKVDVTLSGINNLLNFINSSSNTADINNHYVEFNNKIKSGEYLSSTVAEERRQELWDEEPRLSDQDTYNYQATGNTYSSKLSTCQAIPQQMQDTYDARHTSY